MAVNKLNKTFESEQVLTASEYLLPSEIPTPDCYYDFSKGSNEDERLDKICN